VGTELAIAAIVVLVLFAIAMFVWRVAETKRSR
jgi:hypothetical protein